MKSRSLYAAASVLLTASIVAGIAIWGARKTRQVEGSARNQPSAADAPGKAQEIVRLGEAQLRRFGVTTAVAGPARLHTEITLPGEVTVNADRVAHIVPRVSAIVSEKACPSCHGAEKLAAKYGVAVEKVKGYEDSFHGLSEAIGDARVAPDIARLLVEPGCNISRGRSSAEIGMARRIFANGFTQGCS